MLDLPLHHIGVACKSIEKEYLFFSQLGYAKSSTVFIEAAQGVKGIFISAKGQPRLELLENIEGSGRLDTWLKKGVKFYHFAYVAVDIENELENLLRVKHAKLTVPLTTAVFFNRICFVMLPNMLLIELVELHNNNLQIA